MPPLPSFVMHGRGARAGRRRQNNSRLTSIDRYRQFASAEPLRARAFFSITAIQTVGQKNRIYAQKSGLKSPMRFWILLNGH